MFAKQTLHSSLAKRLHKQNASLRLHKKNTQQGVFLRKGAAANKFIKRNIKKVCKEYQGENIRNTVAIFIVRHQTFVAVQQICQLFLR